MLQFKYYIQKLDLFMTQATSIFKSQFFKAMDIDEHMSISESNVCKNMNVGKPIILAHHITTRNMHVYKDINIPKPTNMHKSHVNIGKP